MSDRCRINILATGCAELRHWAPTNCHWDRGGSLLEAVAKFDYVTPPGQCAAGLCVTHRVDAKLWISGGQCK